MQARELAAVGAGVLVVVVAMLLVRRPLDTGMNRARAQLADVTRGLAVEPESGQTQAGLERFRARREAVAAMRADLRRLVALETAFIADSGHPTSGHGEPVSGPQ